MKKLESFLVLVFSALSLTSCGGKTFEKTLIKYSTFTNRMSHYTETITFSSDNKYEYKKDDFTQSGTFNEVYDYEYEYYVKGEILSMEVHKRKDHVKIYSLEGLTKDDKQVYICFDNQKYDFIGYSYYNVGLFEYDGEITSSVLDEYRSLLTNTIASGCYGKVHFYWNLYHYQKEDGYRGIDSITLNQESFYLKVNETAKIEATISTKLPTDQYNEWLVGDEEIISIESRGSKSDTNTRFITIKALKIGETNVIYKCGDGKSATIPVTVTSTPIERIKINLNVYSADTKIHPTTENTLYISQNSYPLSLSIYPYDATYDANDIIWTLNDENNSAALEKGVFPKDILVKSTEPGDVTITAEIDSFTASITLHFINKTN